MYLKYRLISQNALSISQKEEMYQLMTANYNRVNRELFEKDLAEKQLVIVLSDEENHIQGFTTLVVNPGKGGWSRPYYIMFSGDTVISPKHWGTQLLVKAWCHTLGGLMATYTDKPWYWYLISKGHRTYMYLPLFCKSYYPALTPDTTTNALNEIADEVSTALYPRYWLPQAGILRFEESMGELKPTLAQTTWDKKKHPQVAFFLSKNPGFYKGEELVCVAPLHPDNLLRTAREFVLEGMKCPLHLDDDQRWPA